jgi:hypothetical protein
MTTRLKAEAEAKVGLMFSRWSTGFGDESIECARRSEVETMSRRTESRLGNICSRTPVDTLRLSGER